MKKEKEVNEEVEVGMHVLDILLDEENDEPIVLFDENDKAIRFDQVAIIPLEEKLFAILKPIDPLADVADDEAIVFRIQEDEPVESQLVVETDDPYLTPVPFRGKENKPAYVYYVVEEIAKIKNLSFEEVEEATYNNALKVYKQYK